MKQKIILVVSVIIGLLAAIASRTWITMKEREYQAQKERLLNYSKQIEVVAVSRSLAQGTVLRIEDLGKKSIFKAEARDDVIKVEDVDKILGRKLKNTLSTNDPLLWSDIEGGKLKERTLADEINSGKRAVSISVSGAAAVSGMIRPNDRVDVLGTFTIPSADASSKQEELVTLTVLQNITVVATGTNTKRTIQGASNPSGYSTVTLLVTPKEAELLVFTQQIKGRLVLSLRNPSDNQIIKDLPRLDFNALKDELNKL